MSTLMGTNSCGKKAKKIVDKTELQVGSLNMLYQLVTIVLVIKMFLGYTFRFLQCSPFLCLYMYKMCFSRIFYDPFPSK